MAKRWHTRWWLRAAAHCSLPNLKTLTRHQTFGQNPLALCLSVSITHHPPPGHMTMLLGAARLLKEREAELPGTVLLVFQPAEEGGAGADLMIQEGAIDGASAAYALHVWPTLPTGQLATRSGTIMAGVGGRGAPSGHLLARQAFCCCTCTGSANIFWCGKIATSTAELWQHLARQRSLAIFNILHTTCLTAAGSPAETFCPDVAAARLHMHEIETPAAQRAFLWFLLNDPCRTHKQCNHRATPVSFERRKIAPISIPQSDFCFLNMFAAAVLPQQHSCTVLHIQVYGEGAWRPCSHAPSEHRPGTRSSSTDHSLADPRFKGNISLGQCCAERNTATGRFYSRTRRQLWGCWRASAEQGGAWVGWAARRTGGVVQVMLHHCSMAIWQQGQCVTEQDRESGSWHIQGQAGCAILQCQTAH